MVSGQKPFLPLNSDLELLIGDKKMNYRVSGGRDHRKPSVTVN